jgi:sirohydrochlorin ferrochelatase
MGAAIMTIGIVIIDHGSRGPQSNELLHDVVHKFAQQFGDRFPIVEPAHMELAGPDLAQAFARCVVRGAEHVVIVPLFLAPGKHMTVDIPRLATAAATTFPSVTVQVAAPLGADDLLVQLLSRRAEQALRARSRPAQAQTQAVTS